MQDMVWGEPEPPSWSISLEPMRMRLIDERHMVRGVDVVVWPLSAPLSHC